MDLEKLPVWSAYIVAPLLVLAFGFQTNAQSENPILLGVMAMVCGGILRGSSSRLHLDKGTDFQEVIKVKNE